MSSQAQSLPLIRLIILMVASLTAGRADPNTVENALAPQETQGATAVHRTAWRKVFRTEFKYTPTTPPDPAVQPEAISEAPADPDAVVLPKYVVRETAPDYRELEKVMRSPSKGADTVAKKLGIGRHEAKFRRFSIGGDTIFFIPISGGISW